MNLLTADTPFFINPFFPQSLGRIFLDSSTPLVNRKLCLFPPQKMFNYIFCVFFPLVMYLLQSTTCMFLGTLLVCRLSFVFTLCYSHCLSSTGAFLNFYWLSLNALTGNPWWLLSSLNSVVVHVEPAAAIHHLRERSSYNQIMVACVCNLYSSNFNQYDQLVILNSGSHFGCW